MLVYLAFFCNDIFIIDEYNVIYFSILGNLFVYVNHFGSMYQFYLRSPIDVMNRLLKLPCERSVGVILNMKIRFGESVISIDCNRK